MNNFNKQYGIVVLLDALGTRQRIIKDLDSYITDWELVINKLQINIQKLNQGLSLRNYKSEIKMKDIFDNIQVFYPIDDLTDSIDKEYSYHPHYAIIKRIFYKEFRDTKDCYLN